MDFEIFGIQANVTHYDLDDSEHEFLDERRNYIQTFKLKATHWICIPKGVAWINVMYYDFGYFVHVHDFLVRNQLVC